MFSSTYRIAAGSNPGAVSKSTPPTGSLRAAMLAALVPAGALLSAIEAEAIIAIPPYSSFVESTVSANGPNFDYAFEVFNTTNSGCDEQGEVIGNCGEFLIVDWELPLFSLDDIVDGSIVSPDGWTFEIIEDPTDPGTTSAIYNNASSPYGDYSWDYEAGSDPLLLPALGGDPDLYGPNPDVFNTPAYIIHWYTEPVVPGPDDSQCGFIPTPVECIAEDPIFERESRSGFGFTSAFAQQNAPYLSSWLFNPTISGDPPIPQGAFGTPMSPARQAAQNPGATVPAPVPLGLLLAGLGLLSLHRRNRWRPRTGA